MKRVLITGGSEGIGRAIALWYARRGYALILTARDPQHLCETAEEAERAGAQVRWLSGDLSDEKTVYALHEAAGEIDVLVNCAGIGRNGAALESPDGTDEKMIALNCTALALLCRLCGRDMAGRGSGLIINIASTGAFQPGPYTACYYATKAFVLSYSRALREELRGSGVHVCCVCPGPVRTAFYSKANGRVPRTAMTAEETAAYALERAEKKAVVVCGLRNRILLLIPSFLRMKAVGWIKRRSEKIAQKDQEHVENVIR